MGDPQYRANFGTPEQLPKGEAQSLNEAAAAVPEAPPADAQAPPTQPASETQAAPPPLDANQLKTILGDANVPDHQPADDWEKYIFSDTQRPMESVSAPAPQPGDMSDFLPELGQAVSEPGSSPKLRALYMALVAANETHAPA